MNKIEEIEELLAYWKAAKEQDKTSLGNKTETYYLGGIGALKAALYNLKRPSNTQLKINELKCCSCGREYNSEDWPNAWKCNNCF